MNKRIVPGVVLLLSVLAAAVPARACLVAVVLLDTDAEVQKHFHWAEVGWTRLYRDNANVFEATVVAKRAFQGGQMYTLRPERVWKSDRMVLQEFFVPPRPKRCVCMCGPEYEVGERNIFFANRDYGYFKVAKNQGNPLRVAWDTDAERDHSGMTQDMIARHGTEPQRLRAHLNQLAAVRVELRHADVPTPAPRRD